MQTVANAADALQRLASVPVDVLFTDINLPGGMDGAALARRAREMRPHLPVVYASARATLLKPGCARAGLDHRAEAVRAGARRAVACGGDQGAAIVRLCRPDPSVYSLESPPRARNSSSQWM